MVPEGLKNLDRQRPPHVILPPAARQAARRTAICADDLRNALRSSAQSLSPVAEIRVHLSNGKLLATLHRDAEILHQEQTNGVVTLRARIEARLLGRLRQEGVEVVLG